MESEATWRTKYSLLKPQLDDRALRLCLAAEATIWGSGGVSYVARAVAVSRTTVQAGIRELKAGRGDPMEEANPAGPPRIRRPGAGRPRRQAQDEPLLADLHRLLDPVTRGDPMSALRWTCKSTTKLAAELRALGHRVSQASVWRLLDDLGYSMQSNRKTRDGDTHPDRKAHLEFISTTVNDFLKRARPVVSVDTKKQELMGSFKNAGREWHRTGQPEHVKMHAFADPELGKAIPYGVYDSGRNEGWGSVGITHDTAAFAVETIRRWWYRMGKHAYPQAVELLITADGGGSNGARVRLWKREVPQVADDLGLTIHVRHFPPGTSKWHQIEHRMCCHITDNWRGRPLISQLAIVSLISNTRPAQGLAIQAELAESGYETGKKVTARQMAALALTRCDCHGEWNYYLSPRGTNVAS